MELKIPPILDLEIVRLSACAVIEISDAPNLESLEGKEKNHKDAIYDGENWIHINTDILHKEDIDEDIDLAHLHIDLAIKPPFWNPRKPRNPTSTLVKIIEEASFFEGLLLNVIVTCDFLIARETIPKRGLAYSILGLSAKAMDAKLKLIGARMFIEEAPPYTEIFWEITPKDAEDKIKAKIVFRQKVTMDENYLINFARIAREGIDRFILEKKKENVVTN